MAKALPTYDELVGYNHAVAGHDGILSDVSGELFIKPCTPTEIAFYETSSALYPEFMKLMPTYLGTLALDERTRRRTIEKAACPTILAQNSDQHEDNDVAVPLAKDEPSKVTTPQSRPQESTITRESNSRIFGNRITTDKALVLENASYNFQKPNILDVKLGVRLWADDAAEDKRIRFDRITAESTHKDLGFRIAGMRVWQGLGAKGENIDKEGYKIYDKNYGRVSVNRENVNEAFTSYILSEGAGIDGELGRQIAQAFLKDLTWIQTQLESHENRMFSASLLFVYEGDGKALRNALGNSSNETQPIASHKEKKKSTSAKIYSVKLIDFAHAEWTPGQGPDENTLLGVRSVVKIFQDISSAKQ
ncbi:Inositol polyphosphate multikinase [Golovinomyces cichoracearum]|uniref:Kinase n=1 Tax=Golovinomyces cichoracearum TaxID=62708 RepID=A0A420IJY9_9PEZI|nr:Inositol polyphosphate multikinase [Golovinomyces cichoracearum]